MGPFGRAGEIEHFSMDNLALKMKKGEGIRIQYWICDGDQCRNDLRSLKIFLLPTVVFSLAFLFY